MPHDLINRSLWNFPTMRMMSLLDEDDSWFNTTTPSGLSISEDENNVYIEAAVPGVESKDVDMTFHNGVLKIHAKAQKEEKKDRKTYKEMTSEFSYQISIRDVDPNEEPEASLKNGVMEIRFAKSKAAQPKKITVK